MQPIADVDAYPATGTAGRRPLGEVLVAREIVSRKALDEALAKQAAAGQRLGALVVELGLADERDVVRALASHFGVEYVDLRRALPDAQALRAVPEATARALDAIPLSIDDGVVTVAVSDPTEETREALARAAAAPVRLVIAAGSDIRRALDRYYRLTEGIDRHIAAFEATEATRRHTSREADAVRDDAPVVQVVNMLISQALRDRASDIHIEPQDRRIRVRFRVDGALHDVLALPVRMAPAVASRIKIMAGMNIVERRRPQDGQITLEVSGRSIDIRVATTSTIWGEKIVLRLLDTSKPLYRLGDLGMAPAAHEQYSRLARSPFGMVICAGPTGSGKTTTLYATISELDETERNITTIEDPVEYVFPTVNQIQINEQAGITFANGLRSILRQDPDVILVGEVRDTETARIAVQSALTGHFVLSSMHATDATSALHRLLDMGIEAFLVASSVVGVVGQRLVRRVCPQCAERTQPTPDELAFYREAGGRTPRGGFVAGAGCNFCGHTGYHDRVGVYELLRVTNQMRELLVTRPTYESMRTLAIAEGMQPLRTEAMRLVSQGVTTISEVVRTIYVG